MGVLIKTRPNHAKNWIKSIPKKCRNTYKSPQHKIKYMACSVKRWKTRIPKAMGFSREKNRTEAGELGSYLIKSGFVGYHE